MIARVSGDARLPHYHTAGTPPSEAVPPWSASPYVPAQDKTEHDRQMGLDNRRWGPPVVCHGRGGARLRLRGDTKSPLTDAELKKMVDGWDRVRRRVDRSLARLAEPGNPAVLRAASAAFHIAPSEFGPSERKQVEQALRALKTGLGGDFTVNLYHPGKDCPESGAVTMYMFPEPGHDLILFGDKKEPRYIGRIYLQRDLEKNDSLDHVFAHEASHKFCGAADHVYLDWDAFRGTGRVDFDKKVGRKLLTNADSIAAFLALSSLDDYSLPCRPYAANRPAKWGHARAA